MPDPIHEARERLTAAAEALDGQAGFDPLLVQLVQAITDWNKARRRPHGPNSIGALVAAYCRDAEVQP